MLGHESPFETQEMLEQKQEQQLALLLKEKGLDDPEAHTALNEWIAQQEQWADNSENSLDARIEVDLRTARLYLKAGLLDDVWDNFEYAKAQAWSRHNLRERDSLYQAIVKEVEQIEEFFQ